MDPRRHFTSAAYILAVTCFIVGLSSGVMLQKYYPAGRMLRTLRGHDPLSAASDFVRTEVSLSTLRAKRVMVVFVFGQSNAANYGESRYTAQPGVYNFYNGKLYRAQDPLLGAEGVEGSIWARFGDQALAQGRYDAVVIAPLAIRGTEIAKWTVGGKLHEQLLHALDDLNEHGLAITHMLWQQGEADAQKHTRTTEYIQDFKAMVASIRKRGVDAPLYVALSSRCYENEGDPDVRRAQQIVVDTTPNVYPGPDLDELGLTYRYDGCHFSNEGMERAAALWLERLETGPRGAAHQSAVTPP